MSKKIASTMLILMAAALAANCGDDSNGSSGGDAGMGGGGTIDDAGESAGGTGSGATSSGGTNAAGSGEAGSSAAGTGDPGGGPSVGGAGGADGVSICPDSIADFPTVFADAVCRKRVECCQNDTETCMTELSAAMDDIFPDLAQAGQDGTATASCSALEQCVAAIDAADCADWPKELGTLYGLPVDEPACRGIVKGTLAPAAECRGTYECNNGFCGDGDGAGGAGTTCVAMVADGQPCGQNICNLATSYCAANAMCAPRLANGADCTAAGDCQSRICDTANTDKCVAPAAAQCEYVPEGCSLGRRPVRDSRGWPLLVATLVLGAAARRRRRRG